MKRIRVLLFVLALVCAGAVNGSYGCDHNWIVQCGDCTGISHDHLGNLAHAHWDSTLKLTPVTSTITIPASDVEYTVSITGSGGSSDEEKIMIALGASWPKQHPPLYTDSIPVEVTWCQCKRITITAGTATYPYTATCSICSEQRSGSKQHKWDRDWIDSGDCGNLTGCGGGGG